MGHPAYLRDTTGWEMQFHTPNGIGQKNNSTLLSIFSLCDDYRVSTGTKKGGRTIE